MFILSSSSSEGLAVRNPFAPPFITITLDICDVLPRCSLSLSGRGDEFIQNATEQQERVTSSEEIELGELGSRHRLPGNV